MATWNNRALILFKWLLRRAAGKGKLQRSESGKAGAAEEGSKLPLAFKRCGPESLSVREGSVRVSSIIIVKLYDLFSCHTSCLSSPVSHFRHSQSPCMGLLCPQTVRMFRNPLKYKNFFILVFSWLGGFLVSQVLDLLFLECLCSCPVTSFNPQFRPACITVS